METGSFEIDRGSEKNFGVVSSVVFTLVGAYVSWTAGTIVWWPFIAAALLMVVAIFRPELLRYPNLYWFKFGLLLGAFIAPLVMALVYVTTVVPVGLIMRWTGKDLLNLKLDPNAKTYWKAREMPMQPMKNQF